MKLSRELVKVAGRALTSNISSLGPRVLPLSEKVAFAYDLFLRKVCPLLEAIQPASCQASCPVRCTCLPAAGSRQLHSLKSSSNNS